MNQDIFERIIAETEKAVNGFKAEEWENRGLFERFRELFKMVDGYKESEEQKVYLFRRGVILLAVEAVHDIFPATDYFRDNPAERFLVFRTPGQKRKEKQIDEWVKIEKANWERQGETGGEVLASAKSASTSSFWWN